MGLRHTSFVSGEYYHIYNRGNSKQKTFLDEADYQRFLKLLFLCNSYSKINFRDVLDNKKDVMDFDRGEALVDVGAFCLMPNHFHLLVREGEEGNISLFMKKLSTAYVMYFNKKYDRTGSLFEGRFKSEHASDDRYLKYLFAYIHLNPVKLIDSKWKTDGIRNRATAYKFIHNYEYSSYPSLVGDGGKWGKIINYRSFPNYFSHPTKYKREIFDWLSSPRTDLGE